MNAEPQVFVVVAPVFGTNCCVVAASGGQQEPRDCVIVDAGAGVADDVVRIVDQHGLRPRAVLATHGHVDHTWDAAALCERYDVPLRIHAADAYRIADPFGTLIRPAPVGTPADTTPADAEGDAGVSSALTQALAGMGFDPARYRAPSSLEPFETPDGPARLRLGALTLRAVHAPGHTEGSTLYVLDTGPGGGNDATAGGGTEDDATAGGRTAGGGTEDDAAGNDPDGGAPRGVVFSGDVLFAGSIGRTDLPGGDGVTMRATLRDVVARLERGLTVVPGHGPTTTVARELATNPFLG